MRIVLVGDWHSRVHEEPMAQALKQLGHEVIPFPWHVYFRARAGALRHIDSLFKRAQNKYLVGPALAQVNDDLLALVVRERPQAIMVYRGTHILRDTLRRLRNAAPEAVLVGYNNDDPQRTPYVESYGHYEDELVKVEGQWLFKKRTIFNELRPDRAASGKWPLAQ